MTSLDPAPDPDARASAAGAPLATIGIPTYNRCARLARSVASARQQDYPNLEILIVDNASTDQTPEACRSYAAEDPRVIHRRQSVNLGPVPNFLTALNSARGEYFMWLADDDWIDPDYVSRCVDFLERQRDHVGVAGRADYRQGEQQVSAGTGFDITGERSGARVLRYYWQPGDNSVFYGIWRTRCARASRLPNCVGGDWLFVAGMAVQGKFETVDGFALHRERGGTSSSLRRIVQVLGAPRVQAWLPFTLIAWNAFLDAWKLNPAYATLSPSRRLALAAAVLLEVLLSHGVIENLKKLRYYVLNRLMGPARYDALKRRWLAMRR